MEQTAFQKLVKLTDELAEEIYIDTEDMHALSLWGTEHYVRLLAHIIMHYCASWFQWDEAGKMTIYQYNKDFCDGKDLDLYYDRLRKLRLRRGDAEESWRYKYDRADLMAIENSTRWRNPLVEYAGRKTIYNSHRVPNAALVNAYKMYDGEYVAAREIKDPMEYVATSIYFYRIEQSFAFTLIAQIASYMEVAGIRDFDWEFARWFWTGVEVRDIEDETRTFFAPVDVLHAGESIPRILKGREDPETIELLRDNYILRRLHQNVFERLPLPDGENYNIEEVASFIRYNYPIIERRRSVSFDDRNSENGFAAKKLRLIRKVMKKFYSTESTK